MSVCILECNFMLIAFYSRKFFPSSFRSFTPSRIRNYIWHNYQLPNIQHINSKTVEVPIDFKAFKLKIACCVCAFSVRKTNRMSNLISDLLLFVHIVDILVRNIEHCSMKSRPEPNRKLKKYMNRHTHTGTCMRRNFYKLEAKNMNQSCGKERLYWILMVYKNRRWTKK